MSNTPEIKDGKDLNSWHEYHVAVRIVKDMALHPLSSRDKDEYTALKKRVERWEQSHNICSTVSNLW